MKIMALFFSFLLMVSSSLEQERIVEFTSQMVYAMNCPFVEKNQLIITTQKENDNQYIYHTTSYIFANTHDLEEVKKAIELRRISNGIEREYYELLLQNIITSYTVIYANNGFEVIVEINKENKGLKISTQYHWSADYWEAIRESDFCN